MVQGDFDGNPRTNDQHWVRFDGNKKMMDPWVGKIMPVSTYTYTGYAIIKRISILNDGLLKYAEKDMTAMRLERDKNWTKYRESEKQLIDLKNKIQEVLNETNA